MPELKQEILTQVVVEAVLVNILEAEELEEKV